MTKDENKEILLYITKYLDILDKNFDKSNKKMIPYNDIIKIIGDLDDLMQIYALDNYKLAGKLANDRYIPLLNLLVKIDDDKNHYISLEKALKNAYRIAARVDFEKYLIYREWGWKDSDKYYAPRMSILRGYVHYLQEIDTNPNFRLLIANYPSGYGKSYTAKLSEAWSFGYDDKGTVLYLCSNDSVSKSGSNTVRTEMKSDAFGEVFPNLKYDKSDKNYFLKETDSEWKLKNCRLAKSYVATTTNSNVVGERASKRVHIDDLYANSSEAQNQQINQDYFNNYNTVWRKRFIQNVIDKVVITGTLWASGDFIDRVIENAKKEHTFHKDKNYPYTYVSEDGSVAIIKVPALDYETGLSSCPQLRTTSEILRDKSVIDEYLFQTNFQQLPTNPESLYFSYDNLRTYEKIPPTDYIGAYSFVDTNRKKASDFFSMPIFKKVPTNLAPNQFMDNSFDYYLADCIYTQTATKDLYEDIVDKIVQNHIIELVIESNATSELKQNLDKILKANGISFCEIKEKWNTTNKEARINDNKGTIRNRMVFPERNLCPPNSHIGRFMNDLTTYSLDGRNKHDDGIDSLSSFAAEIIDGGAKPNKAIAIKRPF